VQGWQIKSMPSSIDYLIKRARMRSRIGLGRGGEGGGISGRRRTLSLIYSRSHLLLGPRRQDRKSPAAIFNMSTVIASCLTI